MAALLTAFNPWWNNKTDPPKSAIIAWEEKWKCSLRFESGGKGALRFGAAGQDLKIAEWSLEMDAPFDKLTYRSSVRGDAFWFPQKDQITFHLLKEGKSIKRVLNVKIAAMGGGESLNIDGLFKTELSSVCKRGQSLTLHHLV